MYFWTTKSTYEIGRENGPKNVRENVPENGRKIRSSPGQNKFFQENVNLSENLKNFKIFECHWSETKS